MAEIRGSAESEASLPKWAVCEKACWLVSEPPSSGLVENRSLKGVLDMAKGKKSSQKAIPLVEERIPLVEERVSVTKRTIETGRVRVKTIVDENQAWVREELAHEEAIVEHVPVGREVTEIPEVRHDGDVLIVPVIEEMLVVEKRLVLKEELHIRKQRRTEQIEEPITVRSMRAVVEREPLDGDKSE